MVNQLQNQGIRFLFYGKPVKPLPFPQIIQGCKAINFIMLRKARLSKIVLSLEEERESGGDGVGGGMKKQEVRTMKKKRYSDIPEFKSLEEEKEYWEARGPLADGHRGTWNKPKLNKKRNLTKRR